MMNRYLAFTGQTTIEFWKRSNQGNVIGRRGDEYETRVVDFRQPSKIKNMEYIFGTTNVLKMLLPSVRSIGHDGVNWENYISKHTV